jgi:hypothetical protein
LVWLRLKALPTSGIISGLRRLLRALLSLLSLGLKRSRWRLWSPGTVNAAVWLNHYSVPAI